MLALLREEADLPVDFRLLGLLVPDLWLALDGALLWDRPLGLAVDCAAREVAEALRGLEPFRLLRLSLDAPLLEAPLAALP